MRAAAAASEPPETSPTSRRTARYADGDDVHARVALGVAVRAELRQRDRGVDTDTRLLTELPLRGFVERLGRPLEAAGDRPHALERLLSAADEQYVEQAVGHRQDHDVDRDREGRKVGRVVVGGNCLGSRSFGRHDRYRST